MTTPETQTIEVETPDGPAEAYLTGTGPGVLLYMDAIGLRPQIQVMCERIASWGYTVLAPNVFHRDGRAADVAPHEDLRRPGAREAFFAEAMPRVGRLTSGLAARDIPAYLAALREHCDDGPVGTVGYCMGARLAVRTANADPGVAACAGFHGGGLATDEDDSPHRGLGDARAELVFGHADQDRSMPPEAIERLGQAAHEAGLTITNEVYAGAPHGYSMADTSMYDEAAAERSFEALRALLDRTLR